VRLAVLASHGGTTLQAVIDACAEGTLDAAVVTVISNNSNSGAIKRARAADIPTHHVSAKTHPDGEDGAILDLLKTSQADYVLLLGYMKKLGANTLAHYQGRILNTHPALLPKFGGHGFFGRKVHEAVIEAGERESGATIHLVDQEYDTGPLLSQVKVPVYRQDDAASLETRVKAAEQKLLVQTLIELTMPLGVSNY
jgi:phosphoribosylglycinamide formyltransferase-1